MSVGAIVIHTHYCAAEDLWALFLSGYIRRRPVVRVGVTTQSNVLVLALGAMIVVPLLSGEAAIEPLYKLLGTKAAQCIGHSMTVKVLGILILVALMISLNPELRVVLLVVDSVGVDIFLLLVVFQSREYLWVIYDAVMRPAGRYLADLGPYPLPLRSRSFFHQPPLWAVYGTAQLMAVGSMIAMLAAT